MTRFAAALLLSLAAATQASAFSMNVNLPDLTFPPSTTTISAQNAIQPNK
ncbi:hypothetical protein GCM10010873_02730 [Cypionkella aquatica]|uniref:Uncharacterized protein n=1 Tax=Cypionkella aquatica TaxID=1756042 RepID=A0AA37TZX5_9RHOB|nr:hypothetical protein [Cypionkella aquatica]GLS85300.1 hypothetical protein GCM10010873_02730 [Cypionkella aquatica]